MANDRFMIAPMEGGLQTDLKPWLIPDSAFEKMNNAYIFRGRVRKRFGSRLMNSMVSLAVAQLFSRLRINIGTVMTHTIPGGMTQLKIGQLFSVGTDIFTVHQLGPGVATLSSNPLVSASINSTTNPNTITFTGEPAGSTVFYYPANPVMALIQYQVASALFAQDPTYAFDTQFAYQFNAGGSGGWSRLGTAVWTGSDSQFFWGTTWQGVTANIRYLFVTNNNAPDLIKYWTGSAWVDLNPAISVNAGILTLLATALIIVVFKNRLVALNTTETTITGVNLGNTDGAGAAAGIVGAAMGSIGDYFSIGTQTFRVVVANGALQTSGPGSGTFNTATGAYTFAGAAALTAIFYYALGTGTNAVFTNRARWAAYGDPTEPSSWRQDINGKGNALDAATMEDIISAEFVKDRLIVFFESSTWEFAYTGNQAQPFTWQQLNTELGAESTFSTIPFDKFCLTVGNVGIHECNGVNVQRIDNKIPDTIRAAHTENSGVERIYGIRDYDVEQAYWTFPNVDTNVNSSTYPGKVLVYNYKTDSWAFNDDSITVFGYYYASAVSAVTWDSTTITWDNDEVTWDAGTEQPLNQIILAGNQEGFIFIIDSRITSNAPALQLTNIDLVSNNVTLTVINHNLNVGDWISITNLNGLTPIAPVTAFNGNYKVVNILTANTFIIIADDIYDSLASLQDYAGGGVIARVSQIDILTKQFNFYVQDDRNAYVSKVNFQVDRTDRGQITVDYMTSTSPDGNIEPSTANGVIMGTNILETTPFTALYPYEADSTRLWHPVYLQADGEFIQLNIYLSDEQLEVPLIASAPFQMHAMIFYATRTSARLQ